jgi:putative aldouronate transport system permease protein
MLAAESARKTLHKNNRHRFWKNFQRERQLWFISIPLLIWVGVFCYYPMYGVLISFFKYYPGNSIFGSQFVGFTYFMEFFKSVDFPIVMRNTLVISGLNILLGFPAPIILALLLNEIRNRAFKRITQTISYLPYFISWVVVASMMFSLLGTEGFVNEVLKKLGLTKEPVLFMTNGPYFWWILTFANIWKGVGWSSIIYLSAITSIDPELYQAGKVDGLNRLGLVRHITIPGMATTIVLLWILGIGGILNAGFEQQLLLGNPQTRTYYEVVDTYAYKYGIQMGRYSYGAAVGLMKSFIGLILVLLTNRLSRKMLDVSIL